MYPDLFLLPSLAQTQDHPYILAPASSSQGVFPLVRAVMKDKFSFLPLHLLLNQMEDSYDSEPRVPRESVCKHQLPLQLLLHTQCWRGPDSCSEELSTLVPSGCRSDIWGSSCLDQGAYFSA